MKWKCITDVTLRIFFVRLVTNTFLFNIYNCLTWRDINKQNRKKRDINSSDLIVVWGGGGIEWPLNIANNWWFCRERSGHPSGRGSEGDGLHQPGYTDRHGPVEEAPQTRWDRFIIRKHASTSLSLLEVVSFKLIHTLNALKIFLQKHSQCSILAKYAYTI